MTTLPSAGYLSDALRTQAEVKTALEAFLAGTRQLIGAGGAVTTLTIASGSITPTTGAHIVGTEGAAVADDLANIAQTNLPDGSLLFLSALSSLQVVILKHGAGGTGQLALADAADLSLIDPTMVVLFRRMGTLWAEVDRFYGNQAAALRIRYDLATLTAGANTFTKTQQWAQGANIASASTLTLGTDGNRFVVTGAVGITGMSNKPVGTRILLEFASTPQLTHHATNLKLQNGQPFTAAAGDELELVSIGTGQWKEINRQLATQPVGFQGSPVTHLPTYWEDFLGGSDGVTYTPPSWAPGPTWVTNQGSGFNTVANYRGVVRLLGDTLGIAPFTTGNAQFAAAHNPTVYVRWAQTGAAAATRKIGGNGGVAGSADPSDGIYFRHAAAGNIIAVCRTTNVESVLDTAVPAADGVFHTGRFVVTGTTSVAVYIDEILKGTITSNIPSASLTPWFASTANANIGLDVDYFVVGRPR